MTHRTSPLLRALLLAGTQKLFADSADADDVARLGAEPGTEQSLPIDLQGNTMDAGVIAGALGSYLATASDRSLGDESSSGGESPFEITRNAALLRRIAARFAGLTSDGWETSLPFPMGFLHEPGAMLELGRLVHATAPGCVMTLPFTPQYPHCLIVAGELERHGIPVELISTFSVRQAVAGALLANVTRVRMSIAGINARLEADLLGEHVALETQRTLSRLRAEHGVRTRLVVSIDRWQAFARIAGCDAITAPRRVYRDFLASGMDPHEIRPQVHVSYEDDLCIPRAALRSVGRGSIARLYAMPRADLDCLFAARRSGLEHLVEGDRLRALFDDTPCADLFHAPDAKALDTRMSLAANAVLDRHQASIDVALGRVGRRVAPDGGRS